MAFDPICTTISIISLIVIIICVLLLYKYQTNTRRLTDVQIEDLVNQINNAHLHQYALIKKLQEDEKALQLAQQKLSTPVQKLYVPFTLASSPQLVSAPAHY